MSLWSWQELNQALGLVGDSSGPDISGVSIDSRSLQAGDLFVALSGDPGPRFHSSFEGALDGHDFLAGAIAAGAAAVLVDREVETSVPQLRVEDTLDGLWDLARFARKRIGGRVVAITGSSGKTTARACIEHVLGCQGVVHASESSLNNHWGVPLSLARMPRNTEYGVFEIGMNHPGEIAPLAELVSPGVALVLNVLPAHLGFFENIDAIRNEKLSIERGLPGNGTLVVPDDLDLSGVGQHQVITFGLTGNGDIRCQGIEKSERWRINVESGSGGLDFVLEEGGQHRVLTGLATLAVVQALAADMQQAARDLGQVQLPEGRGNRHNIDGILLVDDSYNANPASVSYALDLLGGSSAKRKIAILGDMLELGERAAELHAALASNCDEIDRVITVGSLMKNLHDHLPPATRWWHVDACGDLDLDELSGQLRAGDELMIKGSKKIFWLENFTATLLQHLRDRQKKARNQ